MIDNFLLIPDAESLPSYRMVLKLACVTYDIIYDIAYDRNADYDIIM